MNSMAAVLLRVPLFKSYRKFGWPRILPLNLTLSPSPKCNSRCLTCNIWMKRERELTLEEWDKVLTSLGQAPYWITISGGEPLMYPHIAELAQLSYEHCRPGVINIPTNGILPTIPEKVDRIARSCPKSQLIVNLSLDGVGEKHDFIRGVPGNFKKLEQCLEQLLSLRNQLNNLTVGIHSVVSVFNVGHLEEIMTYADRSGADQFITEIAEPRVELDTVGLPITPSPESYAKGVDRLIAAVERKRFTGVARITEALRVEYYKLVKRILNEQAQVIACYAGWVSAHIYADGAVWPCCVRADNLGNLRDHNYDFKEIWFGEKIQKVRRSIAAKECHCPLANASYTNMLHHIPTLARIGVKLWRLGKRRQQAAVGDTRRATPMPTTLRQGAGEVGTRSRAFEWLDRFQHHIEKEPDYAAKTLAAYRLAMKARGSIVSVAVLPAPNCCLAARNLPAGKLYHPDQAPLLPLPDCPQGRRCGCIYRPVMTYQQADGGDTWISER